MQTSPLRTNDAAHPTSTQQQHRKRVLVVEDNWETRMFMEYAMRHHYRVDSAPNAIEALEKAARTQYDVCLVDIALSGAKDGVQVLNGLREMQGYADTPIVAVTAYALPGDRTRFLKAGFNDYLGKPFRQDDLLELLQRWMNTAS